MALQDYKEHSTTVSVSFTLTMSEKEVEKVMEQGVVEYFKLSSKISTSNMMCFDAEGKIKKYNSPEEIMEDFYAVRLAYYQKRKVSLTSRLTCCRGANISFSRISSPMTCNARWRNSQTKLVLYK